MTSVETELRTALIADAGVSALLGARLYWMQLPQAPSYPCAVYHRVSTVGLHAHGTKVGGIAQPGVYWSRVSFTIWSAADDAAEELSSIVQGILGALNHIDLSAIPESPVTTLRAPNLFLALRFGIEPNTQPPLFKAMLDVKVWFQDQ